MNDIASRVAIGSHQIDSMLAIAGNHIAAPRRHTADDVGAALNKDSNQRVGQGLFAGDICANVIAANCIERVCDHENGDAVQGIAGNHIARAGGDATDGVRGSAADVDPVAAVGQRIGAGRGKADDVALNKITTGPAGQKDSMRQVAGNHIAETDEISIGSYGDAGIVISQSQFSNGIRADKIPRDDVAGGTRAGQINAVGPVAGNDIAKNGI